MHKHKLALLGCLATVGIALVLSLLTTFHVVDINGGRDKGAQASPNYVALMPLAVNVLVFFPIAFYLGKRAAERPIDTSVTPTHGDNEDYRNDNNSSVNNAAMAKMLALLSLVAAILNVLLCHIAFKPAASSSPRASSSAGSSSSGPSALSANVAATSPSAGSSPGPVSRANPPMVPANGTISYNRPNSQVLALTGGGGSGGSSAESTSAAAAMGVGLSVAFLLTAATALAAAFGYFLYDYMNANLQREIHNLLTERGDAGAGAYAVPIGGGVRGGVGFVPVEDDDDGGSGGVSETSPLLGGGSNADRGAGSYQSNGTTAAVANESDGMESAVEAPHDAGDDPLASALKAVARMNEREELDRARSAEQHAVFGSRATSPGGAEGSVSRGLDLDEADATPEKTNGEEEEKEEEVDALITSEHEKEVLSRTLHLYNAETKEKILAMTAPPEESNAAPFIGFSIADVVDDTAADEATAGRGRGRGRGRGGRARGNKRRQSPVPETEPRHRLLVDGVYESSPAAQVGVEIDDELLQIGGTPVRTLAEVRDAVAAHCRPGYFTSVQLRRYQPPAAELALPGHSRSSFSSSNNTSASSAAGLAAAEGLTTPHRRLSRVEPVSPSSAAAAPGAPTPPPSARRDSAAKAVQGVKPGEEYTVDLWVVTADPRYRGKTYFFDRDAYAIVQSDRLKRTWAGAEAKDEETENH